jgi:uncharacterized protein YoxC
VTDPLFWLVLSLLFVTISLTIVLVVAIPTFRELSRAARSAEKLFDTLRREFPPTLQAIRLTGLEISDLTEDVSEGVQSAGQVVKQVDQSLSGVRQQAQRVQYSTRSVVVGLKAAWRSFTRSSKSPSQRRGGNRLPTSRSEAVFDDAYENDAYENDAYENDAYENDAYESEHPNEVLPESQRTTTRRVVSQEETLNQSMTSRNTDLGSRSLKTPHHSDPRASDPHTSEKGLSAPTSRNVDRSRSALPKQAGTNTATPDPRGRQPGVEGNDRCD